jgi:hypothetical protein
MITEQIETPTHTRTGSANQEMSRSTETRISLPDESREWPRLGAELTRDGVRYCAWSPEADLVTVEVIPVGGEAARSITLERAESGYFAGAR